MLAETIETGECNAKDLVWTSISPGRDLGRQGHQLRPVFRERREGGVVPLRRAERDEGIEPPGLARAHRSGLARIPAGPIAGPDLRLSRLRPLRARAGAPLQSPQGPIGPLRQGDCPRDRNGPTKCSPIASAIPRPICRSTIATMPPWRRWRVVERRLHLGRRPAAPHRVGQDDHLRTCTSRVQHAAAGRSRRSFRGTYAGLGSETAIEYLKSLGVTAVELLPIHEFVPRPAPGRARADELLGLQHAGLFRPRAPTTPRLPLAARRGARIQDDGPQPARGRHRGDSRRGLQPHRRRKPARSDASRFRGIDNACYYRLAPDNSRHYMDFTGCGNMLNMLNPRVLQLIMDSLRYWVLHMHVDGFRFDLASTLARELARREPAGHLFRRDPPGPRDLAGEADRRALGPGRRRLPGGQFPAVVVRVERQVPRRDSPLLEGRRRQRIGVRHPHLRLQRSLRVEQPPAARQHQLRHFPRRIHAPRPGLLQRQAQRGQRRKQPGRRLEQPQRQLRRRGPQRRSGDPGLAGKAASETSC